MSLPSLLLVGGGRMGAALLAGWRESGLSASHVVDPAPEAALLAGPGIAVVADAASLPPGFAPAAIVLAVKPQVAASVVPAYAALATAALTVSIMAGPTLATLGRWLGPVPRVRAMPNTPAAIRRGITVACPGPGLTEEHRALAHRLLEATGVVEWIKDEALLAPVTAVSGSGPAYVFLLAELLAEAAIAEGLPPALAARLARETVAGSGALLAASPDPPEALRRAVTSPKGTTERALSVLTAAWPDAVRAAIAAATARARELAGE